MKQRKETLNVNKKEFPVLHNFCTLTLKFNLYSSLKLFKIVTVFNRMKKKSMAWIGISDLPTENKDM